MKHKYPIKFDDEQLILEAGQVADTYHKLTLDLFDEVIDRLLERGTASLADNPYIWQLEKLNQMHLLNEQNLKTIAKYSKIGEEQLRQVIEGEGFRIYKDTKQHLIDDLGEGELGDSSHVQELLSGYFNQSYGDIKNLINTTLPQAVSEVYRGIIQDSVARVVTGLSTHDKAINETVMKWQDAGFKGFVDKGGKRWKIDNYARTVIKTTAIRSYREMRTMPAEELGIDTYYYSKKATAREACAPLQHHIVTTGSAREEEGYTILSLNDHGYGTPGGCLGINCGHILTPFIPGINELPELGEDAKNVTPEQAIENANAEAKQRALERSIRNNKEKLHVAEKLGDKELIDKYKSKVRIQQGAMRDYLKQHPFLHRDYAREKYLDNSPYKSVKREWLKNADLSRAKVINADYWEQDGIKYHVDGRNVIFNPSEREREVANMVAETFGKSVKIIPEVKFPHHVKTPDYLINGVPFDLKEPIGNGNNTLDNDVKDRKEQARSFILDISRTEMDRVKAISQIDRIFRNKRREWIDEIILVEEDEFINIFKRKK
jgi:hypothetical protein|nr:MAG TPA: minor capsid protein [Caudoviricetes sp.]